MPSYTVIYALFALTSLVLFNALILLSRYIRQAKEPPKDPDYELLLNSKRELEQKLEGTSLEAMELKNKLEKMEPELEKLKVDLAAKIEEFDLYRQKAEEKPKDAGAA